MAGVRSLGLSVAILGLCTALPASAGDWDFDLRTGLEFQGETDLDRDGEFDFWLWSLGGSASSEIAQDLRFTFDADYRLIGYDFSGIGFDPWEEIHVVTLSPTFRVKLTEVLSLLMGPSLEFSGETSADLGDSLKAGGKVGIGYQFSDDLRITLGVVVSSEIEDDVYIQPLVHFDWSITDDVRLGMHADASRGGDVRLGYTFFEDWTVAVGGGFRRERFRLNDDGPSIFPFDRRDGVGEEEATVLSARLSYAFTDKLTLEGYVGGTLDGEFRLENERGHRILKSDYDDAVYGGFRFELGF